jgi:hypothetical protein
MEEMDDNEEYDGGDGRKRIIRWMRRRKKNSTVEEMEDEEEYDGE